MNNQSDISGNQNIVIQNVNGSQITIVVNGVQQELLNGFEELKAMVEKWKADFIQTPEGNYAIHELSADSFDFVTGKRSFNALLTQRLLEGMMVFQPKWKAKFERVLTEVHQWEQDSRYSDPAKELISYSFVGVLGIQLSKLLAIGKEASGADKHKRYLKHCGLTAQRALELIAFTLLSRLWDASRSRTVFLTTPQRQVLRDFFEDSFERDLNGNLRLLQNLAEIFTQQQLDWPLPELQQALPHWANGSAFTTSCREMQKLYSAQEADRFSLADCFVAERLLVQMLEPLLFLVQYKMVSIQSVSYHEMRNQPRGFLHCYAALGIDNKRKENAELVNFEEEPVETDAVLLFSGRYQQSVNLFPFIIDLNALLMEEKAKICFYAARNLADNSLNFRFLADDELENISLSNEISPNTARTEWMRDREKLKKLKLHTVAEQMELAAESILALPVKDYSPQADQHG